MQSSEKLGEAFSKAAAAFAECAHAVVEYICEMEGAWAQILAGVDIAQIVAYQAAEQDHSEWVHRATYSKKKRIRKKYHDKIMRMYGRAKDGKM